MSVKNLRVISVCRVSCNEISSQKDKKLYKTDDCDGDQSCGIYRIETTDLILSIYVKSS